MKRSRSIRGINLSTQKALFIAAVVLLALSLIYVASHWVGDMIEGSSNPSALSDGVSNREFERRKAINANFYEQINGRYLAIAKRVTSLDASVGELPDLERERTAFVTEYRTALDSTFAPIITSSLYTAAQKNIETHNNKMFEMIIESYPNAFWINSERLFNQARDPLAEQLRHKNRKPRYQPRCCYNSQALQAANVAYYKIKLSRYKIATVQEWVVDYRQRANLPPLSDELLGHYEHLIELDKAAAEAASAAARQESESDEHDHECDHDHEHNHECDHDHNHEHTSECSHH